VAIIATWHFFRAGYFSWRIFWPFAVGSIPFAFIGGALSLPGPVYKKVLGLILLFAAYRLFHIWSNRCGRLFLSPLLLFMGWAKTKQTAGVSAALSMGEIIGSGLGSRQFVNATIYRLLAVVLVIAGAKLMFVF